MLKSSLSNHKGRNLKIRIRNFSNNYLQTTSSLSFCWANYEVMNKLISDKPFNGICWSNVEELLERWYNWLKDIIARTVPKRTANRSSLSPWVKPARSNIIKKLETAKLSKKSTISKIGKLRTLCETMPEDKSNYGAIFLPPQYWDSI